MKNAIKSLAILAVIFGAISCEQAATTATEAGAAVVDSTAAAIEAAPAVVDSAAAAVGTAVDTAAAKAAGAVKEAAKH